MRDKKYGDKRGVGGGRTIEHKLMTIDMLF